MRLPPLRNCFLPLLLLTIVVGYQLAPKKDSSLEAKTPAAPSVEHSSVEPNSTDESDSIVNPPEPVHPAIAPGQHCYTGKTAIETIYVRLTVEATDTVTGDVIGSIHNEAASYYTDYAQAVKGTISGNELDLTVETWIEYDNHQKQNTWTVGDSTLDIAGNTLSSQACDIVSQAFQNEDGLEASDLLANVTEGIKEQIYFETGQNTKTVSDSVLPNYRDIYLVSGRGAQQMTLSLNSAEGNAHFDIVGPSGIILGTRLTQTDIALPLTGQYQILVGASQGNATYALEIDLR